MSTKGNNGGNKFLGIFFILAAIAEYLFWSKEVGIIKYILWGVTLIASVILLTNQEDPIQPGKFWACVLASLALLVIVLALNSVAVYG